MTWVVCHIYPLVVQTTTVLSTHNYAELAQISTPFFFERSFLSLVCAPRPAPVLRHVALEDGALDTHFVAEVYPVKETCHFLCPRNSNYAALTILQISSGL